MREHRMFAALYDRMTAPVEREVWGPRRERLLGGLTGDVLDVGAGTGANLPYLTAAKQVTAVEPDAAMRRKLTAKATQSPVPVTVSDAGAEALPCVDAVVFALVLCTVPDPDRALSEARRVLKPGGKLLLLEHVRGTGRLARWQDRLVPLWRRMNAGCHPNRDTRAAVERAGFEFRDSEEFQTGPGWLPTSPTLAGVAEVA
ncbi:MAG: methyltransferase domain-containing protein [Actinophytocola sp.]|nr:methyltransferase domain-containing protein [Actinophytocola sp.]